MRLERRLLQGAIAVIALAPALGGLAGVLRGLALTGTADYSATADSHFRYLSGLLFAIGLAYWSCVPTIERKAARLTLLTAVVFTGGLARAFSWLSVGPPSRFHIAALGVELALAPAMWLWQRRVAAGADLRELV